LFDLRGGRFKHGAVHEKPGWEKIPVFFAIQACRYACRIGKIGGFVRPTGVDRVAGEPPNRILEQINT
jgi:hypothetical protein